MRILENLLLLVLVISQIPSARADTTNEVVAPAVPTDHDTTLVESHPDPAFKKEAKIAGKKVKAASKRQKKLKQRR